MPRAIWKGAIAFGLVHIPVAMYPASSEDDIDFDWIDRRTMDPVGYKRVNKRTGKEITRENIVRGVKTAGGEYVVLDDEEIRAAYPRTTQTIDIEDFVPASSISFVYLERPYYLEPTGKSGKVYALLREALVSEDLIGIARIVMRTKEHIAAVRPDGPALMLGLLRWAEEIRPAKELDLPSAGKNGVSAAELKMARQLIGKMASEWKPEKYRNTFTGAIRKLVQAKAKAGKTETVTPLEDAPPAAADNVIDLTRLLKQSLEQRKPARREGGRTSGKSAGRRRAS